MKTRAIVLIAGLLIGLTGCSAFKHLPSRPLTFSCVGYSYPPGVTASAENMHRAYKQEQRTFLFSELQQFRTAPESERTKSYEDLLTPIVAAHGLAPETDVLEAIGFDEATLTFNKNKFDDEGDKKLLILSGGGQWGAFGATFLADPANRRDWDVVTGISTGALQALFVGAGDYDGLVRAYTVRGKSELATKPLAGPLRGGSIYDTNHLKVRVITTLLDELDPNGQPTGGAGLLERIAANAGIMPHIYIGAIEARTGNFVEIDITQMVKDHYPAADDPNPEAKRAGLADCVAGWALGSSAVPVQLLPVRIAEDTPNGTVSSVYMDGGVRTSAFVAPSIFEREVIYSTAATLRTALREDQRNFCKTLEPDDGDDVFAADKRAEDRAAAYEAGLCDEARFESFPLEVPKPEIFVLRNGPTWVPPDGFKDIIDRKPGAYNAAMRSYATLVNQNELTSVLTIMMEYPRRPIHFVSADGFNWHGDIEREDCRDPMRDPDTYFDPPFMACLRDWGRIHSDPAGDDRRPSGWREIRNSRVCSEPESGADTADTLCQSASGLSLFTDIAEAAAAFGKNFRDETLNSRTENQR